MRRLRWRASRPRSNMQRVGMGAIERAMLDPSKVGIPWR